MTHLTQYIMVTYTDDTSYAIHYGNIHPMTHLTQYIMVTYTDDTSYAIHYGNIHQ